MIIVLEESLDGKDLWLGGRKARGRGIIDKNKMFGVKNHPPHPPGVKNHPPHPPGVKNHPPHPPGIKNHPPHPPGVKNHPPHPLNLLLYSTIVLIVHMWRLRSLT